MMPRHVWAFFIGSLFLLTGIFGTIFEIITFIQFIFYGIFTLFGAFMGVRKYRNDKERLIGILQSYESVSIKQLSHELISKEKRTNKLLLALRAEGRLIVRFEPDSDYLWVLEVDGKPPEILSVNKEKVKEEYADVVKPKMSNYCLQCGSVMDFDDQYCRSCGSLVS